MLKVLFHKELMQMTNSFFVDPKTHKRRSTIGIIGFIVLYVFLFISFSFAFVGLSMAFSPLLDIDKTWLYFALMGSISIFVSSIINMFIANSHIFNANDNDLLLSLPIKPSMILLTRIISLYIWGLIFVAMMFIPAIGVFWVLKGCTVLTVIMPILVFIFSTILTLGLSIAFGFVVGAITSRLKSKAIVTTLVSLILIGVYYFFYFRFQKLITAMLENTDKAEQVIKGILVPFYHLGLACEGKPVSLIIFAIISFAVFIVAFYLLSKNFIKIATRNNGQTKKVYKEELLKVSSSKNSYFKKELLHFVSSPAMMMNIGLGILIVPIAGVAILIKAKDILPLLDLLNEFAPKYVDLLPNAIVIAGLFIISTGCYCASTISLEGKNMWILKSLPVDYREVLKAKIKTQNVLFIIPTFIFAILVGFAFKLQIDTIVIICLTYYIAINLSAYAGLAINLKKYNLDWTNETYVIKQGLPVLISLLGGWVVTAIYGVASYFLIDIVSPLYVTIGFIFIMTLIIRILANWIMTKGIEEFENM